MSGKDAKDNGRKKDESESIKGIRLVKDCKIGDGTKIYGFTNLYGCEIGKDCMIGTFVEIQKGAKIGNNVRVQSHSFICEGVTIEDDVFIGHGVMFINDRNPSIKKTIDGTWKMEPTLVKKGASIGNNATILPVTIGENSLIGGGAVLTHDAKPYGIYAGNPARKIGDVRYGKKGKHFKRTFE